MQLTKKFSSLSACCRISCTAALIIAGAVTQTAAQAGYSSASLSRSSSMAGSTSPNSNGIAQPMILNSKEIVVDEILNYHRHKIAQPNAGESVGIDLRWGNDHIAANDDGAVLQIGFTTTRMPIQRRAQLRPANLTLVIDHSGSMAGVKLAKVKEAMLTLVSQMRSIDTLSIVIFDDSAQVLLPPQLVQDAEKIKTLIRGISDGGGTEIYDGLMLGYRQAQKSFCNGCTNRVILLTDGISSPKSILADSLAFNKAGIDLATIGVGEDVNEELLRQLAKQGHGLFHFVADPHNTKKVFEKELESLLSPVARDVRVQITFDPQLELLQFYGYEPKLNGNNIELNLNDMNHGLTQVLLMSFALKNGATAKPELPVSLAISYYDIDLGREVTRVAETRLKVGAPKQAHNKKKNATDLAEEQLGIRPNIDDNGDDDEAAAGAARERYHMSELENEAQDQADQNNNTKQNKQHQQNGKNSNKQQGHKHPAPGLLNDNEVRKNYTIALLAQGLKDMSAAWEQSQYVEAEIAAANALSLAGKLTRASADKDIVRVYEILQRYSQAISRYNSQAKNF